MLKHYTLNLNKLFLTPKYCFFNISHPTFTFNLTLPIRYGNICGLRCGVEQWQLVGLITRRSQVRVLPPLLDVNLRPPGYAKQASPAVFGSESLPKRRIFHEP